MCPVVMITGLEGAEGINVLLKSILVQSDHFEASEAGVRAPLTLHYRNNDVFGAD